MVSHPAQQLLAITILIVFASMRPSILFADELSQKIDSMQAEQTGLSVGFFPGYQWSGGSRPFPLDYFDGTIRTGLAARYHFRNRMSLQLTTSFARTSGKVQQLGIFLDEFGREVSVAVDLPEFSTQLVTLSANYDWLIGSDTKRGERLSLSLGFGFHRMSGKATYLLSYNTFIEKRLLSYPAETDPLSFLGFSYSRNLSSFVRVQLGTELAAFVSTDPGFDEFEDLQTRGTFLVLVPTIQAGIWFMIGNG